MNVVRMNWEEKNNPEDRAHLIQYYQYVDIGTCW